MADSVPVRAPGNYLLVDLRSPAEAEYWLIVLDASRQQVEDAVMAVGMDARVVAAYLRNVRSSPASQIARSPCTGLSRGQSS